MLRRQKHALSQSTTPSACTLKCRMGHEADSGSFSRAFVRDFRDSRGARESPVWENQDESDHLLEIVGNLGILEILEIFSIQNFLLTPFPCS